MEGKSGTWLMMDPLDEFAKRKLPNNNLGAATAAFRILLFRPRSKLSNFIMMILILFPNAGEKTRYGAARAKNPNLAIFVLNRDVNFLEISSCEERRKRERLFLRNYRLGTTCFPLSQWQAEYTYVFPVFFSFGKV